MKQLTIGLTEGRKYENYLKWFNDAGVKIIQLSHHKNNASDVRQCDGVVFTGGEDIHPEFYDRLDYVDKYSLHDFNIERDKFELEVLSHSQTKPVLGICRGLQLVNVFFGGTLIPDIPSFGKPDHSKIKEGTDRIHSIRVIPDTILSEMHSGKGEVNSAHHQSVDKVGNGLIINSLSNDDTIEGLEREARAGNPFLLLVQWHPERMANAASRLSVGIRDKFLSSMQ